MEPIGSEQGNRVGNGASYYGEHKAPEEDKGQAGTNLAIVILVLVIVVVGVKLLMSSSTAGMPAAEEAVSTSTEAAEEATSTGADVLDTMPPAGAGPAEEAVSPSMPEAPAQGTAVPAAVGKGEVSFSVSSPTAVTVREIFVHNPYRVADANGGWIQVYDGYKPVQAGSVTNIFTVSLAAIAYDEVKVRTLSNDTGIPNESIKMMPIDVVAGGKKDILIAL